MGSKYGNNDMGNFKFLDTGLILYMQINFTEALELNPKQNHLNPHHYWIFLEDLLSVQAV